ncbi:hypothetical protein ACFLS9_02255 [Bacteroidota bacterium]
MIYSQDSIENEISGTIFLEGENYLQFEDILYIHGFLAPASRLNRIKSFKVLYDNRIRVMAISMLKYLKIDEYEIGIGQDGIEVLKKIQLRVETKNRLVFDMPYFELSWTLVKIKDNETGELEEKTIPFISEGKLNIRKIIFD